MTPLVSLGSDYGMTKFKVRDVTKKGSGWFECFNDLTFSVEKFRWCQTVFSRKTFKRATTGNEQCYLEKFNY